MAIGMKCYLVLPNHVSLNEGHCFIVPMQHVANATSVDEDVWEEIQVGDAEPNMGYCKSTNFGVLLYLANLANCVF